MPDLEYTEEPLIPECTKEMALDAIKKTDCEKERTRFHLLSACIRDDWQKAEIHRKKLDNLIKVETHLRNILNRVSNKKHN